MKLLKFLTVTSAILTVISAANPVLAGAIAVGDSSLIQSLDYSDTFTQNANRVDGAVLTGDGLLQCPGSSDSGLSTALSYRDTLANLLQ